MKVEIKKLVDWDMVKEAALATENKRPKTPFPTEEWKAKILRAEHSPIRCLQFFIRMEDIPYYVAMHLVRHKHGVEWFVGTSREDRTGVPRDERKQTDLVNLSCIINAQALIAISRKRLCNKADIKTRDLWRLVKKVMYDVDMATATAMQPECVYRGKCNEMKPCNEA
jgi:hypothetical protein